MPLDLSAFTNNMDEYTHKPGTVHDFFQLRNQRKRREIAMALQKQMAEEQLKGAPLDRDLKKAQAEYQSALAKEAMQRAQQASDPTLRFADKLAKAEEAKQKQAYTLLAPIQEELKAGREASAMGRFENIYEELPANIKSLLKGKDGGWSVTPEILEGLVKNMARDKGIVDLQKRGMQEEGLDHRKDLDIEQREKDRNLKERLKNLDIEVEKDKAKYQLEPKQLADQYQKVAEKLLTEGNSEEAAVWFMKAQRAAKLAALRSPGAAIEETNKEALQQGKIEGKQRVDPSETMPTQTQKWGRDPKTGKPIRTD